MRRRSVVNAASCAGVNRMLRANRMTPHGFSARSSAVSSADSAGPAIPTIAAFRSPPPSSRHPWHAPSRRTRWPERRRRNRRAARAHCLAVVLGLAERGLALTQKVRQALGEALPLRFCRIPELTAVSWTIAMLAAEDTGRLSWAGADWMGDGLARPARLWQEQPPARVP